MRYGETGEWVAMDCRGIDGGLLTGLEEWVRGVMGLSVSVCVWGWGHNPFIYI